MEQRLIDATYAIALIKDMRDLARADVLRDAIEKIKAAPTVDAVPVCRCRECKYWDRSDPFFFYGVVRCECKRHENEYWTADGFCSDAERNDSEIPNS